MCDDSVHVKTYQTKRLTRQPKRVWKPISKNVATTKPQWKPTGRHFSLYEMYPLTRITEPTDKPIELPPSASSSPKITMISRFTDHKLSDRKAGSKGISSGADNILIIPAQMDFRKIKLEEIWRRIEEYKLGLEAIRSHLVIASTSNQRICRIQRIHRMCFRLRKLSIGINEAQCVEAAHILRGEGVCHDTRRSTSGSAQFLGHRLVSWSSKKQKSTAISTTEGEYIALIQYCWCSNLLHALLNYETMAFAFQQKFRSDLMECCGERRDVWTPGLFVMNAHGMVFGLSQLCEDISEEDHKTNTADVSLNKSYDKSSPLIRFLMSIHVQGVKENRLPQSTTSDVPYQQRELRDKTGDAFKQLRVDLHLGEIVRIT
ncbi:reverse transcriptase domain-containing protein [Tanacetum coccineum]